MHEFAGGKSAYGNHKTKSIGEGAAAQVLLRRQDNGAEGRKLHLAQINRGLRPSEVAFKRAGVCRAAEAGGAEIVIDMMPIRKF